MNPYADEVKVDKMENVIAIKKGKTKAPKVMLAAHMDEVGLMVKTITKEGFLQFTKMGGIDDRILLAQKVTVYTKKGQFARSNRFKTASHPKRGRTQKNRYLRRPVHRRWRRKPRRRAKHGR